MAIKLVGDTIVLSGSCGVEEAERLLALLHDNRDAALDLSNSGEVHTAVWQVVMALRPTLLSAPPEGFYKRWIVPAVAQNAT
ncbi:MAG: hypothetical protein P0Y65_19600 [Candidatus Devosia phytovorans]|uniref:Uncharacterized protein n=1 Tax=Candidatus Devosia phytovorans TaxID=3121372 RepID=A0AAJ5VVV5_9HYPH|nr:hypothetical protein [Devosia sp.]WEK04354.1 MAG: hypothetical protein P0Y65_19600 [Devosia sp.]